jgi:uncharacterized protein
VVVLGGARRNVERFTPVGIEGAYSPDVAETHSGIVFFAGDRAFKMKKAVDLGFLDFTARASREAACRREVTLNRRLAPDVYLGVADVHDAAGEVCDHLVVMRRMPADRRLSTLVLDGAPVEGVLADLARLLVDFHERAERSPEADRIASAEALGARWHANTTELRAFTGRHVDADAVEAVDRLAARYLVGRGALFASRIARGRACDGHGDLLADDIFCLDDGPRVLDCLEFDDALRLEDVLADVAFLVMDLERLGRVDLAERFLESYRIASGDDWPASLAHHHIAYRAQVRAKVSAIRADQGVSDAAAKAQELLELARAHLQAGRIRLVLVGGLPGTGKSTLARGLADALGAVVLHSDVVRKELAGIPAEQHAAAPFGRGLYDQATRDATYRELLARAEASLGMGQVVVIDASWNREAHRADARRVAEATASDLVELRCVAPPAVVSERLAARAAAGSDPSDADAGIAAAMAAIGDPWSTAIEVDTAMDPTAVIERALDHIGPI